MRISLDRVDTRGVSVDLPSIAIAIDHTTNLRGLLARNGGKTTLSGVHAEEVALSALGLELAALVLEAASGGVFRELSGSVTISPLAIDARAAEASVPMLSLDVGGVSVRGRIRNVARLQLVIDGASGVVSGDEVVLEDVVVTMDGRELATPAVRGTSVRVAWGAPGFELAIGDVGSPALTAKLDEGVVTVTTLSAGDVTVRGSNIDVGRASIERVELDVVPPKRVATASVPPMPTEPDVRAPLIDWRVLDALSGEVDVDLAVDLTVPILGNRKATHRLRVAVDAGTIDFVAVEHNLAALEDAIIDFSVRENQLVLERVNPLFPMRGHGKPVVVWTLPPADIALAQQKRVRLSVLPEARLVAEPSNDGSPSAIAIRHLALVEIDTKLALAKIEGTLTGQIRPRELGALHVTGNVHYDPGAAAPPGKIAVALERLTTGLELGAVAVGALRIATAKVEVAFADVTPTALRGVIEGIALDALRRR